MVDINPYNLDAEQVFIGCMFLDNALIKECTITAEQIYTPRLRRIFQVMKELDEKGKPIDVISLVEQIGVDGLEHIGGIQYITQLACSVPTTANFRYYEDTVRAYFHKRKTIEVANSLLEKAQNEDIKETVREGIGQLMEIEDDRGEDDQGEITNSLIEMYKDCESDLGEYTGIPSGFAKVDELTGGFQLSDLIIFGARPSVGKTAFALNIALHASVQDVSIIFSMEMPKKELMKRATSSIAGISSMKIRNPHKNFQNDDWGELAKAMGSIMDRRLHIFERGGMDIHYIWLKVRKIKRMYGEAKRLLVIVDYLQLIIGDPRLKSNRVAEISEISRMLKLMARDLNVVVIALSQLSRAVERRQDKRPMLSDFRESGQTEQDADLIALLYRDDYYNKDSNEKNILEVIVARHRNGPTRTVKLEFLKEFGRFLDVGGVLEGKG